MVGTHGHGKLKLSNNEYHEDFTDDELFLPYFHGAILDEDLDKLLELPGDFLLLLRKKDANDNAIQNVMLAVRIAKGSPGSDIYRSSLKKFRTGVRFLSKDFANIAAIIEWFKKEPRTLASNITIHLKRPVNRGKWAIRHKDIHWQKRIGSGAYGQVFRCKLYPSKLVVAAKRLSGSTSQDELAEMMKEARVMQLYDHPNIVKFYGYAVDKPPFVLVMEFCNGGAVEDRIRRQREEPISCKNRVMWLTQAAAGIEYLHKKNCIHRDIATRNCLIHDGTIKIADFGMCRATSVYKVNLAKPQNVRWLAPEVWRTGETNFRTDVYAFAIMMWEMFIIPYDTPYRTWKAVVVKRKVMDGYRMDPPPTMPKSIVKILALCWAHDPANRPLMAEVHRMLANCENGLDGSKSPNGSSEYLHPGGKDGAGTPRSMAKSVTKSSMMNVVTAYGGPCHN